MKCDDPTNAAVHAMHVHGATIAWGGENYFDLEHPETTTMTIEDYAFALAYSCRWRGQTRSGRRVFYGVGEHCVRMAEQLLADHHGRANAFAGLMHESDEVPFGDMPAPAKPLMPEYKVIATRCGDALDRHFNVTFPDPKLIKRYDIRMLLTEKRDILEGYADEIWHNSGSGGTTSTAGYEPFDGKIVPYSHPDMAAIRFLELYEELRP
jgi:hypothetical protein